MKNLFLLSGILFFSGFNSNAQTGGASINNTCAAPHPSAMVDVSSTSKGMLIPRMTTAERNAISNPADGLQIYNITTQCLNIRIGETWKQVCGDCDFNTPVATNNGPICESSSLNLYATTIPGATYSWSGPNGFTSNVQNPIIPVATVAASGSYAVSATLDGCTSQLQTTVATVNATPDTPVASNDGPLCAGSTLNLNVVTINGASYSWTGPNGYSANIQSPSISNAQVGDAGTYFVVATVNGCSSSSGSTTVINTTPSSAFSPIVATAGFQKTFTPAMSGADIYNWTFTGASPSSSSAEFPSTTWSSTGSYNVTLTVTDNGCSTTTTNSVIVSEPQSQTFSYTGDVQTFTIPSGVNVCQIEVWGAQGGTGNGLSYSGNQGGLGGYAIGHKTVAPGNTLYIYVGGQGGNGQSPYGQPGYNGGGSGGSQSGSYFGGGGGGASDVRLNGTALSDRIIIGGGGGGAGTWSSASGGDGAYPNGATGGNTSCCGSYGFGGTQSAGGYGAPSGTLGDGGSATNGQCGAGGGGGYYGGGASGSCNSSGAGGGSSYHGGMSSGQNVNNGVRSGNGQVKISW